MHVVSKDNLFNPNICIICEERPDGDVVDTERDLHAGPSPFSGRKYVCWRCVGAMAKIFGFEKGQDVEQAKADKEVADRKVEVIQDRVQQFADALVKFVKSGNAVHIAVNSAEAIDPEKPAVEAKFPDEPEVDTAKVAEEKTVAAKQPKQKKA